MADSLSSAKVLGRAALLTYYGVNHIDELWQYGAPEYELVDDILDAVGYTELLTERDQAIAHDRQPYPTAWAYEQVCAALRVAHVEVEKLRAGLIGIARPQPGGLHLDGTDARIFAAKAMDTLQEVDGG